MVLRSSLSDVRLAIVCPMANQRETAGLFLHHVLRETSECQAVRFLAVFDHTCQDGTIDLLRAHQKVEPRLEVIWVPESRCVVDAYVAGYRRALETGYEWILEIDAGFSHQPSDIPKFLELANPGVDCIFGSRFCRGGGVSRIPLRRRLLSYGGTTAANLLLGTDLSDMTSGFEMFRRETLAKVLDKGIRSRGHFFQTEIKYHCRDLQNVEVPIHCESSSGGVNGKVIIDALKGLATLFRSRLAAPG